MRIEWKFNIAIFNLLLPFKYRKKLLFLSNYGKKYFHSKLRPISQKFLNFVDLYFSNLFLFRKKATLSFNGAKPKRQDYNLKMENYRVFE